ncbi:Hypothetical protein SMAX5B_021622 [Scophthalmus maximus]|uniref:Uncharacterized protein n=1 Tax=Scophthalmus maximus TaxID=52904 RepID=A0A2U9B109_SCOMX|nr:Hypothetical protein SMAX5B_021622 [Scophthalmus maximus]
MCEWVIVSVCEECPPHVTACNIACERAPAPFVTATIGERSKVAGYSERGDGPRDWEDGTEEGVMRGERKMGKVG